MYYIENIFRSEVHIESMVCNDKHIVIACSDGKILTVNLDGSSKEIIRSQPILHMLLVNDKLIILTKALAAEIHTIDGSVRKEYSLSLRDYDIGRPPRKIGYFEKDNTKILFCLSVEGYLYVLIEHNGKVKRYRMYNVADFTLVHDFLVVFENRSCYPATIYDISRFVDAILSDKTISLAAVDSFEKTYPCGYSCGRFSAIVSGNLNYVVAFCDDDVRIYRILSRERKIVEELTEGYPSAGSFSPNNKYLALVCFGRKLWLYDADPKGLQQIDVWNDDVGFEVSGIAWYDNNTLILYDSKNIYRLDVKKSIEINQTLYTPLKKELNKLRDLLSDAKELSVLYNTVGRTEVLLEIERIFALSRQLSTKEFADIVADIRNKYGDRIEAILTLAEKEFVEPENKAMLRRIKSKIMEILKEGITPENLAKELAEAISNIIIPAPEPIMLIGLSIVGTITKFVIGKIRRQQQKR